MEETSPLEWYTQFDSYENQKSWLSSKAEKLFRMSQDGRLQIGMKVTIDGISDPKILECFDMDLEDIHDNIVKYSVAKINRVRKSGIQIEIKTTKNATTNLQRE